ncbi:MAG TPA: hypothetical protein PKK14_03750 [Pseudomonadales bacterium]|nr:hypothetical protein [Pseudomonadales bacterium]
MRGIKKRCTPFFLLMFFSIVCSGVHAAPAAVPAPLEPWRAWVLDAHPNLACPPQYAQLGERFCRWSGQLLLQADEHGAVFTQSWQLYGEGWVTLPGDSEQWPQEVQVDKQVAAVVEHDGAPALLLPAGEHHMQGALRWDALPTRLALPADTGLLALTVQGKPVAQPAIDAQSFLLFGENRAPATVADDLSVQVFRQVQDGIPLQMETVLRLRVAGRDREVLLGQFLLDGFVPLSLETPLPARIEADGRLRVQLRAGEWELVLHARAEGQPTRFSSKKMDEHWPAEEVWSWQADRQLRQVTPSSAAAMDPSQTDMPAAWRQAPAWLMKADDALTLTETQRGEVAQSGDSTGDALSLRRELWLDFDGSGMTSRDVVSGTLRQAGRFSVSPTQTLGRAEVNGEPQLITRLDGQPSEAGVELRAGALNVLSVSRLAQSVTIPITAWQRDMNSVSAALYLPPGWMLLHAQGVDRAVGSWLSRWNLWTTFLVLVTAAASFRLLGAGAGGVALLALVLTAQTADAPLVLWLLVLMGLGLYRALPEGRLRHTVSVINGLMCAALLLLLLAFAVEQARSMVYPQLELGSSATIQQGGTPAQGVVGAVMQAADNVAGGASVALEATVPVPAAAPRASLTMRAKYASADAPQRDTGGYDASAQIQTGPGEPAWRWQTVSLNWSGPVLQDQSARLYLLSPMLHKIWRLAAVLLTFGFAALLLRALWPHAVRRGLTASKTAVPVLLLGLLLLQGQPVWAQEQGSSASAFPSKALLDELAQRLTRAPDCEPQCASVNRGQVQVSGNALRIHLEISALTAVAVPLPAAHNQWLPRSVLVDGVQSNRLRRDDSGQLWLVLPAGNHAVVLEGELSGDALQLPFPMAVHNVTASAEGWQLSGLQEGRIPSNSLQLTRNTPAEKASGESARLLPDAAPPFVRVRRLLILGLDWQVQTTVERVAPAAGAINLNVPLLVGEAVLTAGVEVRDGKAQVMMAADAPTFTWTSSLKPAAELTLTAAQTVPWVEVWQWQVAPIWHVAFQGLNPVKAESDGGLPTWQPWPGESLRAEISRPQGVAGSTRTVESVALDYRPGARSADTNLSLQVRSSQGGELPLGLPAGAQVQRVSIDGVEQSNPTLPSGQLKLPLHPGSQQLTVSWRQEATLDWRTATPQPQIDEPLSNIHLKVHLPEGRWLLAVGGPLMGPALLYWGVLTVIVLVAIALGRSGVAPLATWQWLLLGIGMSTVNAAGSLLVVAWFVAMARRRTLNTTAVSCGNLQLTQILLVLLSLLALGSLVGTIPASLLSSPDMQVAGNQSTFSDLLWYQDRSAQGMPTAWLISVPMWVYRAVMLLWSLWLVFSLMAWCRWGWQCFSSGELWRSSLPMKKTAVQSATMKAQESETQKS